MRLHRVIYQPAREILYGHRSPLSSTFSGKTVADMSLNQETDCCLCRRYVLRNGTFDIFAYRGVVSDVPAVDTNSKKDQEIGEVNYCSYDVRQHGYPTSSKSFWLL